MACPRQLFYPLKRTGIKRKKRNPMDGNKEKLAQQQGVYGKEDFDWDKLFELLGCIGTSKGSPSAIEFGTPIYSDGARRSLTPGIFSSASTVIYSPFSLLAPYSEPHHYSTSLGIHLA